MPSPLESMAKWIPALAALDVEGINALLHPDFKLHEPDGIPYNGTYVGKDGFWGLWDKFLATWTDVAIEDHHIFESTAEKSCAVMMSLSAKSSQTGKSFKTSLIEYYRFEDGLIIEIKPYYFDTKMLFDIQKI